jgi:hypothetical protein
MMIAARMAIHPLASKSKPGPLNFNWWSDMAHFPRKSEGMTPHFQHGVKREVAEVKRMVLLSNFADFQAFRS